MQLDDIIRQVSKELDIPYEVCHKAYMSAWQFTYSKVQEQKLGEGTTIEDLKTMRPNINIRGIGKFNITAEAFDGKAKRLKILKKIKEEKNDKGNKDD